MADVRPTPGGQLNAGAREQKEECPRCRDFLGYETDWIGRVKAICPHCDEHRPHSRARWLARFAEENEAVVGPAPDEAARWCQWCGLAMPAHRPKFARYCSDQCTQQRAADAKRLKERARPPHPCATEGCQGTTRSTYCLPCARGKGGRRKITIGRSQRHD